MELSQSSQRMHPLVAGAAASVMLVSLLGAAAITGVLPTSHGTVPPAQPVASTTPAPAVQAPVAAVAEATPAPRAAEPVVHHHVVHHTTTVRTQPAVYAQAEAPRPAPVYTQPAPVHTAQNSPVGIGVGAVVGGLLGSQVGGGNGRTLATIAGAVGGGYVGNEIAKRNQ